MATPFPPRPSRPATGSPADRAGATGSLRVALLKNRGFGGWADQVGIPGALPYRLDHLEAAGLELDWTDAPYEPTGPSLGGRLGPSLRQPFALRRSLGRDPVALSVFEGEAHLLEAGRLLRLPPAWQRPRLAVISCWMAERVRHLPASRRRVLRRLYGQVDRLIVYSRNQLAIFEDHLGVAPERLRFVPFGIDDELYRPGDEPDDGYILAAGSDAGRDWGTLLRAASLVDQPVKIACRPGALRGLSVPASVEVLGYVDRAAYARLLARASVVVTTTADVAYPTGQSVVLEAMAVGKPCVVTQTAAMSDYARDGVNSLTVPVGDASAVAGALDRLDRDPGLRTRLVRQAAADVAERFNARTMWSEVGSILRELAGQAEAVSSR